MSDREYFIQTGRREGKTQAAKRADADGSITYAPIAGEPDCLRCGLLRRAGASPDDVLIDHMNQHRAARGGLPNG